MTLSSVRVGDIVHVDKKGRLFFALVEGKGERQLTIAPLCRETYRECTAREVIGLYRKAKGSA